MKTIIAGSRDYDDYQDFLECMRQCPLTEKISEIVSGCARGADMLALRYAKDFGLDKKEFSADWNGLGKRAGHVRNAQMADYADALIAFWDGRSPGTANMIEEARKRGLAIFIYYF